ncbi:ABC transporter A family member [Raphidocelis subcapitata]|uniref:ABC transporter A family member n=1 Tax=Raphidocelis subcapitata TaxID=307507 RepID=A0A2V0P7Q6_9CHLO|nr:ABC transporter A family member [Raphidocelis subcapitata]|eukprot:GBF93217.1 ABC transporter A family member [Raphidocelis subcapitata]
MANANQRTAWERRLDALFSFRLPQQLMVLLYKNVLVAWRSRRATLIRFAAPIMFLLLALVMQTALDASLAAEGRYRPVHNGVRQSVAPIPDCNDDLYIHDRPCLSLVFSPNTSTAVQAIIERVRTRNSPPLPASKVLGFRDRSEAEAFLAANAETTLGAVHFVEGPRGRLDYVLQGSSTPKQFKSYVQDPQLFWQAPVMSAVSREIARESLLDAGRAHEAAALSWGPELVRFPHPEMTTLSFTGRVIAPCIFAACMFGAVSQMAQIVSEKELGLRQAMRTMGLMESSYWGSWVVFDLGFAVLLTLVIILSGMALRFRFFLANDFSLLFALFWLFLAAISGFTYFVTAFINKPQTAVYVGFIVFLAGWTFQGIVTYGLPYTPSFYNETNPQKRVYHRIFYWVFHLMPWNPLVKAILDMAAASNTHVHPGLSWSERRSYCLDVPPGEAPPHNPLEQWIDTSCIFPVGDCFVALAVQFVAYTLLGVWLDNVLPNSLGVRRHPLFFLNRSFWAPRVTEQGEALARLLAEGEARLAAEKKVCVEARLSTAGGPDEDEDVGSEAARIKQSLGQKLTGLARIEESEWLGFGKAAAAAPPRVQVHAHAVHGHPSAAGLRRRSSAGGGAHSAAIAAQAHVHAVAAARASWGGKGCGKGCGSREPDYAVEVFGLRKVFRPSWWTRAAPKWLGGRPSVRDFWAIKDSWFGIEKGSLFCLLGPNGAGKTTTINCLTGALPPTAGDALIYGQSLCGEGGLDRVRSLMGVCPQFDVLWNELSGTEHLTIYGHIKGLRFSEVRASAAHLLERVKLGYAAGVRSGSYSGGMKRRLSVAIALLGDPQIVYLDEPTTGMDPISRRYVWDIINEAKAGRAIVLTTHSMEEADILADRIAIMARGRLKAIGSSIRLKQKYGAGYTLAVSVQQPASGDNGADALAARAEGVREFFLARLGLLPFDEGRCHLHYLVPREQEVRLGAVLSELEARRPEIGASDIQVSLTSLEEVFLTIARKAELAAAQAQGASSIEVPLPDGGALRVSLGQDRAANPADGREYAIKWAQDDSGRLVVLDVLPLAPSAPSLGGGPRPPLGAAAAARASAGGVRRRNRSGSGSMPPSSSLSALFNSGLDILLGGRSSPASLDSSSGGSSASGSGGGSRHGSQRGSQHGGGGGGGGTPRRAPSSSGGGAAAAELGERGYRFSGAGYAPRNAFTR